MNKYVNFFDSDGYKCDGLDEPNLFLNVLGNSDDFLEALADTVNYHDVGE